jgi:transposase
MKLLEDLKLKFPLKDFLPYGSCIVVPGAEFNPDWEAELGDEGYKCFDTLFDKKPVTLVRLAKTDKAEDEKAVYSPPATAKASTDAVAHMRDPERRWTEEDDARLIKYWNLEPRMTVSEIAGNFPKRTLAAVTNELERLRKKGKIKPRVNAGRSRKVKKKTPQKIIDFALNLSKSEAPAYSTRAIAEKILQKFGVKVSNVAIRNWIVEAASHANASVDKSVDTPVHTPVTLDKLASDVKGILDVLDVQGRVLDKLFCALLMQAVEVKQEKGDLSIPPGLWIHYANALLEDDKQYRKKFRLKVEQLLEASS